MNLSNLQKIKTKGAKRIGRGPGSGKGKTATRGTKGQKARENISIFHPHFEGGQRPIFKRLPYKRGKDNPKISKKPLIVNLEALNSLPKSQSVTIETLIKFGIVKKEDAQKFGVKILGDGDLKIPLMINLPTSKSATRKIEKVGGKVILEQNSRQTAQTTAEVKK